MTTWTHINGRRSAIMQISELLAEGQAAQQTPNSINGSKIARRNPNWIFIDLLSVFLLSQNGLRRPARPSDFRHRTQPFVCRQKASQFGRAWKSFTCHDDSCQLERAKGKKLKFKDVRFHDSSGSNLFVASLVIKQMKKGTTTMMMGKKFSDSHPFCFFRREKGKQITPLRMANITVNFPYCCESHQLAFYWNLSRELL